MTTYLKGSDANTRYDQVIDMYEPIGPIPDGISSSNKFLPSHRIKNEN